jgi:hypothetical protein
MSRLRYTNKLVKEGRVIMSEQLDQLAVEISSARELPLSQQPAAFEAIRLKLEAMISDNRQQETE